MQLFIELFGKQIPSYGLMIVIGVVLGNLIAFAVLHYSRLDLNDFFVIEAYTFLGAFIGAKLLYLIVSFNEIQWGRLFELQYFNELMLGGFVFYGGLIGGLIFALCAGKFHKIDSKLYMKRLIFLIPFIHAFGRIGCYMAGCCYGIPYDGFGAVVFPEGSLAPSGIPLFPVQLVEAILLFIIAAFLGYMSIRKNWDCSIESYLILYSIVRFILEFYRYDEVRGFVLGLTTSQWISIAILIVSILVIIKKRVEKKKLESEE